MFGASIDKGPLASKTIVTHCHGGLVSVHSPCTYINLSALPEFSTVVSITGVARENAVMHPGLPSLVREVVHEADQRFDTGQRHGVVEAGAHAADTAVALQICQAVCFSLGEEVGVEAGVSQ